MVSRVQSFREIYSLNDASAHEQHKPWNQPCLETPCKLLTAETLLVLPSLVSQPRVLQTLLRQFLLHLFQRGAVNLPHIPMGFVFFWHFCPFFWSTTTHFDFYLF